MTLLLVLFASSYAASDLHAQNVGVGTYTPDQSAILDAPSTTKGFLITRLTNTQMNAVSSPATGDVVFNTTYVNFYYYDGTKWTPFPGGGWSLTGDAGTSPSTNFLGSKDAQDVVQKTNGNERMRFFNGGDIGLTNKTGVAEVLKFFEPSGSGTTYTGFKAGVQASSIHYTLPIGDGGANQTLVTDGAGTLSWHTFATFGGGGTDPLWARGTGTYAEYSLGSGNKGTGKFSLLGGDNNFANGSNTTVFGDNGKSGGGNSTISGGTNNTTSGSNSEIRGGAFNTSSGQGGYIGGGLVNSVSGSNATVVAGDSNSISGQEAVIINGANNHTASQNDLIFGSGASISGPNNLVFYCPTKTLWGMNTYSPTEAADIVGNIKFSGSLSANGSAGTSPNYLTSTGAGTSPVWGSITVPTGNWDLTGTAGTLPTNYIGTTDANDFVVRTNNIERFRILSTGQIGINTTSSTSQLSSFNSSTTDEVAAIYGVATGSSTLQSCGIWGRVENASTTNTGTIAALAIGNGNTVSATTNVAIQISDGEFATGRTTKTPSKGMVVDGANAGTLYSAQGPAGVIELSMIGDLNSSAPTAGIYQDLGTVTINNQYATASSIIEANVVNKTNGGGSPDPKLAIYKLDVESRAAGSFVIHIGMIPTVTYASTFQGSDLIRVGYLIVNPGR